MSSYMTDNPEGSPLAHIKVPWTVDSGNRPDAPIGSPWIDFAGLVSNGSNQGDNFDAADVISQRLGFLSGYNGRSAACRDTGVSDGFEVIFKATPNASWSSNLMLLSQPGPMAFAVHSGADGSGNNGLHVTNDISTLISGANTTDGQAIIGYYVWSVETANPNLVVPTHLWEGGYPYQIIPASEVKMRFVGGNMECFCQGVRIFGPMPVPTAFTGRTYHGYYIQQGLGTPQWSLEHDVSYGKPWIFRTYSGSLGAAPADPAFTNATSVKAAAGSTSITPTWPSDVAIGKRVWVLVYKNAAGAVTPPVDHTWYVGGTAVQAAGQRYDTFETVCDGTEVAGGSIGAFTGASASYVAVAVTVSNVNTIYGQGSGQFNASSASIACPSYGLIGRHRGVLWAGATAGSTITIPTGFSSIINTGTGGANTLNVALASKTYGLLADELRYTVPAITGSLSPNATSLGGRFEFKCDPR